MTMGPVILYWFVPYVLWNNVQRNASGSRRTQRRGHLLWKCAWHSTARSWWLKTRPSRRSSMLFSHAWTVSISVVSFQPKVGIVGIAPKSSPQTGVGRISKYVNKTRIYITSQRHEKPTTRCTQSHYSTLKEECLKQSSKNRDVVNRITQCLGSEFHVNGPATEKARRPYELCVWFYPNKLIMMMNLFDTTAQPTE